MICIRCQHDSKYPERKAEGKCEKCGGKFAFEPREGARFSDQAFQKAIDKVSSEGKVKWGVEHLYYELCRRARPKSSLVVGCALFFIPMIPLTISTLAGPLPVAVLMVAAIILGLVAYRASGLSQDTLPRGDFEKMWDQWGRIHGKVPSAIQRKSQEEPSRAARAPEPDLEDYSFDRAVICDRARTADLLLANNFHFENNCAILSFDGYPKPAFESVRRMLKRNPRLEVYALHDATPVGCRLAHRLATDPEWFKGQGRVIDVGLRPVHAGPFKALLLPSEGVVREGNGISVQEARWLSEHKLELAAIRPEQVLKRLFRAISRQPSFPSAAPESAPSLPSSRPDTSLATAGAIAVAGTAAAAAAAPPPGAKQKPKDNKDTGSSSSDGGGGGGGDSDWSVDVDSFSSDADSSDGGADSFG
jgi:DNA-directed RNA polymerase subunit RPC12/RpoP